MIFTSFIKITKEMIPTIMGTISKWYNQFLTRSCITNEFKDKPIGGWDEEF